MENSMSVADVLERAAVVLDAPGAWTRNAIARAADGSQRGARASDAVCFCVGGAMIRAADGSPCVADAVGFFRRTLLVPSVVDFNDSPKRTQPEVVAALRRAATLARGAEA